MAIEKSQIGGVILAGGRASRMNYRDKALQPLHGVPLLAHVIDRAGPQVEQLVLSVNHNAENYTQFALPIVGDQTRDYAGPLLGIYSAMRWFAEQQQGERIEYLACFAADVPRFPRQVVALLSAALVGAAAEVSYVQHRGQIQPLFSLWRLSVLERIGSAIESGIVGPKLLFGDLHSVVVCDEDETPGYYFNINSKAELATASALIPKTSD